MSRAFTIGNISELLLPITDFRKNLSSIIEHLSTPRILMKNDEPKAVIMSYDQYVSMEEALETALDEKLALIAEQRLAHDTFIDADDFFADLLDSKHV